MIKAIVGRKVTVTNGNTTIGVYEFDGNKLVGPGGRTIEFSAPEKRQAVADAVEKFKPDIYVTKYGYEMTDEDRVHAWEFSGVENGVHGKYIRKIPGSGLIEVVLKA